MLLLKAGLQAWHGPACYFSAACHRVCNFHPQCCLAYSNVLLHDFPLQNWGKELKLWLGERVVPVVVDDTRADHVKKSFQVGVACCAAAWQDMPNIVCQPAV
jgi:hypothetical protein